MAELVLTLTPGDRRFYGLDGLGEARTWRRGGELRWGGRELQLRPASKRRQRSALADGETELAVTVDDLAAVEPGLLLLAVFVVRSLAAEAAAGVAAT